MMPHIRYTAAACQTDLPNPVHRSQMRANTDRMLAMNRCGGRWKRAVSPGAADRLPRVGARRADLVLIRVSAYMDPWGSTEPLNWWGVGHHMLAHLRTDAYPVYRQPLYPPEDRAALSYAENQRRIARAKEEFARRATAASPL